MACNGCSNRAASDCDYGYCGKCCFKGSCGRHGWFQYECTECSRLFENDNNLKQHMQVHLPRDTMCPSCGDTRFRSHVNVAQHVESGGCRACGTQGKQMVRNFTRAHAPQFFHLALGDRNYDWEIDDEDDEDVPYCSQCHRDFKSVASLLQHIEAKHAGQAHQQPVLSLTNAASSECAYCYNPAAKDCDYGSCRACCPQPQNCSRHY
ncbi:unnamed protein product [Polarella glacialis]|uniref:C2H2-type domain-containing protein n=1 Tax=Polarella glacialis TaxID=89957 RepID=A0A813H5U9_POLGL|nr:unnamed protein product [Polarella glacialis]